MHYVTGLLVHDFVLSGHWSAPMAFARRFYLHFPKVGLGNWPPGFALLQTAWTLPFGVSRVSLLLLMFLLTALLAFAVYRAAVVDLGALYAWLAALLVIAAPLTQEQASMVMAEIPLALASFLAVVYLARFLATGRTADAVVFALWTSAAILIKGNGWVIVFVVPVALAVTRGLRWLRDWRVWLAASIVGVLCLPYTLFTMRIVRQGWDTRAFPGFEYLVRSFGLHASFAVEILGIPLTLIALAGCIDRVFLLRREARRPFWLVMALYGAAIVLFHTLVPTSIEPRKIYQIVPVVGLFAAAGCSAIARRIPSRFLAPAAARSGVAVLAALIFFFGTFSLLPVFDPGFGPVVENLLTRPDARAAAILISSNPFTADAEAALIAEWAERDRTGGAYLVRATKLLARPVSLGPNRIDYALIYPAPDEMLRAMNAIPIAYVILHTQTAARSYTHHALLQSTLAAHPEEWELIYRTSRRVLGASHVIEVYRCRKNLAGVPIRLSVDLTGKIGESLSTEP